MVRVNASNPELNAPTATGSIRDKHIDRRGRSVCLLCAILVA